jgi:hypothetical protein
VSSDEDYARLSAIAKCPIYGGKLEKGHLNTPRYWTNERQPPNTIASDYFMRDHLWTADVAPALKCENCGITIQISEHLDLRPKVSKRNVLNVEKTFRLPLKNVYIALQDSQK